MLYDRFSREEAAALWEAYRHVDDAMQSQLTSPPCPEPHQGLNWEAGFQGGPTAYSFYELPTGVVHPCAEPATPSRAMRLTALGLAWAERAVAPRGTCHGWEGVRGARRGSRRLHVAKCTANTCGTCSTLSMHMPCAAPARAATMLLPLPS